MLSPEIILLFNLTEPERKLVKRLITSFEIETVQLTVKTVRSFVSENPEKRISLVIIRINNEQSKQDRVIRLIRDFVGPLTPILTLVPREKHSDIRRYLTAGADDFIELPLNESRFSISFLILLEMGQIITAPKEIAPIVDSQGNSWNKIVNYFQEGISYFAPKSLIPRTKTDYIFDRWKQIKRLGIGGFGVVWLVEEIGTGRLAVAKTPHSVDMNIRVLRSAAILKRLVHHPNIVHLVEIVKDRGRLILIQQYVDGPTLHELLKAPISSQDRENYFLQLVSVVAYAHKHKILHRDIKPENILINEKDQVKLLDFGIARDLSWQSAGSSSEGTINFMPPEQFEGKSCLASDIWALGVIFYIFATNNVPYIQQNEPYPLDIESTIHSKQASNVNAEIPQELDRIIMKCLQVDLTRRYQDASELQQDLQRNFPEFGRGKMLSDFPTPL
jgi:hypothetical protein